MGTYYVRTIGNDSTGDGSTGNPWATISKAIATVSIGGGHTINVGAGTYAENSGGQTFFDPSRIFVTWVTVQSETGAAADVVILGSSHATYNTLIVNNTAYIEFKDVTFTARANNQTAIRLYQCNHITFTNCVFDHGGFAASSPVYILPGGGATISNITFTNCTSSTTNSTPPIGVYSGSNITITGGTYSSGTGRAFLADGSGTSGITITGGTFTSVSAAAIQVSGSSSTIALIGVICSSTSGQAFYANSSTGVTITGGTFTSVSGAAIQISAGSDVTINGTGGNYSSGSGVGLYVTAGSNIVVNGGTYSSTSSVGVLFGTDGESGGAVSGSIQNVTVTSSTSHGMLIGAGVAAATPIRYNTVHGYNNSLIIKENDGIIVEYNTLHGALNDALYFKAATNTIARYNTIFGVTNCAVRLGAGTTGNKSGNVTFTYNLIRTSGTCAVFNWADTVGDSGGCVVDKNLYKIDGTGNFGTVRATSGILTLAALRTAWSGYGTGLNDAGSSNAFLVPGITKLGAALTGLTIGYRTLGIDGVQRGAFTTTDASETLVDGIYRAINGVPIPENGGFIVWGTSAIDYDETAVEPTVALELAKVPKSDGAVSWNVTALAAINAEVDTALNTAIPGSPTADSVNERVATMDGRILGTLDTGTHKAQTGDSYPVVTHTDYGNAKLVRATTPANTLDIEATGEISANVTTLKGESLPVDNLVLALGTSGLVEKLNSMLEAAGLDYRFTAEALAEAPSDGGLTAQETADAVNNLTPTGAGATGSIRSKLDSVVASSAAIKAIIDNIDVSAVTYVAASNAGYLTITIGRTFNQLVTGLVIPVDVERTYFTIKQSVEDDEAESILQLLSSNPEDTDVDGVQRLNGVLWHEAIADDIETETDETSPEPFDRDLGTLIVNQGNGSIRIFLTHELTVQLASAKRIGWDVKFIDSNGDSTGKRGVVDLVRTETQTI